MVDSHVMSAFAFFIFAMPLLKTQMLSVNTVTSYHSSHSCCLMQTETQMLLVNKA